jgi:hypothetical protein
MHDEQQRYLNAYHNAQTPSQSTARPELTAFLDAADGVLAQAAELARVVVSAHQGAATHMVGGDWSHARKYFSLSEKYVAWADYRTPAVGLGIHPYLVEVNRPMRLTQAEFEAHPAWRNFGVEHGRRPPMCGWLAAPLIGRDGLNDGLIQASDRYEGDFTEQDERSLVQLAALTSTALDALAMSYLPGYREQIQGKNPTR